MKYVAIINNAYPLWHEVEVGRFENCEQARLTIKRHLDDLYPHRWQVNTAAQTQYVPTEAFKDEIRDVCNFILGRVDKEREA